MRIAVAQMKAVAGDIDANFARIEKRAARAAASGAQLLVTPELIVSGYGGGPALAALALGRAEMEARLGSIARRQGIAIAAGFPERDGETVFNSALLTDGGGVSAVYRKSHLYGDYEKSVFAPEPPSTVIVAVGEVRVALLICYDVEFPENARRLARAGADLVLVPTALPDTDESRFIARRMIRVRAFENHVFIAYADHHGAEDAFRYAGLSVIAAPDGSMPARAPARGGHLLFADIAPSQRARARLENDYLADLERISP